MTTKNKRQEWFLLPSGSTTQNTKEYVRAWRAIGYPAAEAIGGKLHSFDPNIAIAVDNTLEIMGPKVAMFLAELMEYRKGNRPMKATTVGVLSAIASIPNTDGDDGFMPAGRPVGTKRGNEK